MLVRSAFLLLAVLSATPAAAKETLTVLTAYHEEVVALFETAFERDNPDIDVQILWRMSHDALPYLRQPNQGGVDVYWSASQRNFPQLKHEGAWQKLAIDGGGLPDRLGALPLADPDGYYRTTETAGYGFAIDPAYLKKHDLPIPKTWQALADARYDGHIALPVPSRFGFAPLMIDSVLQHYGWNDGWALLAELAGNARLLERNRAFVTDLVGSGERGIAPSLDFFVASAQANGAPLQFVYPEPVAYSPAHVAITASTSHREAARRFVEFLLSAEGQRLLFHPDIRKLPVRPDVYRDKPEGQFDPFEAAVKNPPVYDPSTVQSRLALTTALFDLFLTEHDGKLQQLWRRLHDAETGQTSPALAEARRLLTAAPIDETTARDEAVQRRFTIRAPQAETDEQAQQWERAWRVEIENRYRHAERLLSTAASGS